MTNDKNSSNAENGNQDFSKYDLKSIKILYYKNICINIFLGWFLLSIIWFLFFAIPLWIKKDDSFLGIVPPGLVVILLTLGLYKRLWWMRIVMSVFCVGLVFMLITSENDGVLASVNYIVVGIFGIYIFLSSKELFGKDRVTHGELKKAIQDRKKGLWK